MIAQFALRSQSLTSDTLSAPITTTTASAAGLIKFVGFNDREARGLLNGVYVSGGVNLFVLSKAATDNATQLPLWVEPGSQKMYGGKIGVVISPFVASVSYNFLTLNTTELSSYFALPPLQPEQANETDLSLHQASASFGIIPVILAYNFLVPYVGINTAVNLYNFQDYKTTEFGFAVEAGGMIKYDIFFVDATYKYFLVNKDVFTDQISVSGGVWIALF